MASAPHCPNSCVGSAIAKIKSVTVDPNTDRVPQVSILRPGKHQFTLLQRLVLAVVPRVVSALVWLCGLTWRFEVIAAEGVTPLLFGLGAGPEIFCFWHQCVLPCTVYFRRTHATILISQSFDGELRRTYADSSVTLLCIA